MRGDFAETFRTMVLPRLQQRIPICAALIVADLSGFSTEVATLSRTAWRLGGSGLDASLWTELEGWIETKILDAVTAIELRQSIPGAHRDILALFAEQERQISDMAEQINDLRACLSSAWLLAAHPIQVTT